MLLRSESSAKYKLVYFTDWVCKSSADSSLKAKFIYYFQLNYFILTILTSFSWLIYSNNTKTILNSSSVLNYVLIILLISASLNAASWIAD